MFSSFYIKLAAALIIFIVTMVGGLFPIFLPINERAKRILIYGEAFAGGVFLGIGLIHFLPESQRIFQSIYHTSYPFMFLVCALTILFLRFIEDGTIKFFQHFHNAKETFITFLLTILLSVHSLIAGAALGVEATTTGILMIFIAIISHKCAASFSLGVSMRRSTLSIKVMKKLLILFSLMTPIGILFGSFLARLLTANSAFLAEAIFDAIAAGTFLYIATSHAAFCACECHETNEQVSLLLRIFLFIIGLLLMAAAAIWLR